MGDALAFCTSCTSPLVGLVAADYQKAQAALVRQRLAADNITSSRAPDDIAASADVDVGDQLRKLMDDLGVVSGCCRTTLMSFATQPTMGAPQFRRETS